MNNLVDRLESLKNKGYYPDTILDIGACWGGWTRSVIKIYNDSNYFLFEAIDYPDLKMMQCRNIQSFNVLLNDKIEEVDWYEMKNTGDSMYKERTHHFTNCEPIKRESIDLNTFIERNNILKDSKNILIKIDCQGAEIPILKGASAIIARTDFIILELPFFGNYNTGVPTFIEHIKYMDSIGFVPYDIIESHYMNDFYMQIDMIFINKNHKFTNTVNELLL